MNVRNNLSGYIGHYCRKLFIKNILTSKIDILHMRGYNNTGTEAEMRKERITDKTENISYIKDLYETSFPA